MPRSQSSNPFPATNYLDLAYAMQRLVQLGKTDASEVAALAAERKAAIDLIELRLAALAAGADIDPPAPAKRKYTRPAAEGRAQKPAAVAKRPVGRPKGSKNKPKATVAKTSKRAVGRPKGSKNKPKVAIVKAANPAKRKMKLSPEGVAARKLQGRYLGLRRGSSPQLQTQATEIAKAQGVGAALKFLETNQPAAQE